MNGCASHESTTFRFDTCFIDVRHLAQELQFRLVLDAGSELDDIGGDSLAVPVRFGEFLVKKQIG